MKAAVVTALLGVGLLGGAPAASADCTPIGEQGTICTTGDPATGSFGVGVHAAPVNLCVTVFARCP